MINPKWKIGETVRVKGTSKVERLLIEEINTVTCSAGTQIIYVGHMQLQHRNFSTPEKEVSWHMAVGGQRYLFNEVLLERAG